MCVCEALQKSLTGLSLRPEFSINVSVELFYWDGEMHLFYHITASHCIHVAQVGTVT